MWPLLKKDDLVIQYLVVTLLWNYLLGAFSVNPFRTPSSWLKYLSFVCHPSSSLAVSSE
jgi:hypothetical protein